MSVQFAGDKKVNNSFTAYVEKRMVDSLVPRVPKWLGTHHLTLFTLLWSLLIVFFSFFAKNDINWLWIVSVIIVLQYLTDVLDGAVGRARNTGLIKWGYYMDHFLDYIFICTLFVSYMFVVSDDFKYLLFFMFVVWIGFMINSYLSFSMNNEFRVSYFKFGPTEGRIIFLIVNMLLIFFGKTNLAWTLPYLIALASIGLCLVVYDTHKFMWKEDMKQKKIKKSF